MTMLIAGLWHGASWNFVLWGLFHGAALTVERGIKLIRKRKKAIIPPLLKRILFFNYLTLSWVLFRNEFPKALKIFSVMFGFYSPAKVDVLGSSFMIAIVLLTIAVLIFQYIMADKNPMKLYSQTKNLKLKYAAVLVIIWILVIVAGGKGEPFIYFKF